MGSVVFATTFSTPFAVAALTPLVRAISLASAAALLLRGGVGVAGRRVSAEDRRLLLLLLIAQVHAALLRLLRRAMATTFAHVLGPLLAIDGLKYALLRGFAVIELGGEGVVTGAMRERVGLLCPRARRVLSIHLSHLVGHELELSRRDEFSEPVASFEPLAR